MWSTWSRAGVAALIRGLNAIYREKNRVGLRQITTAFGVTFLLIGVALVALLSVVILPIVLAVLPLGPITALLIASVRWVVALAVVIGGIGGNGAHDLAFHLATPVLHPLTRATVLD